MIQPRSLIVWAYDCLAELGKKAIEKDFEQKCIYSENLIRIPAIAFTLGKLIEIGS